MHPRRRLLMRRTLRDWRAMLRSLPFQQLPNGLEITNAPGMNNKQGTLP
jgi:hypothetical protein